MKCLLIRPCTMPTSVLSRLLAGVPAAHCYRLGGGAEAIA
ncbi:hypothetical protein RKD27_000053 [Streptomyces sp. SAI-126]